jgi:hypothetical protein
MIWMVAVSYALMTGLLVATWRYRRFLGAPPRPSPSYKPKAALFVPVPWLTPAEDGVRYRLDARDRTTVARAPFTATSDP